MDPLPLPTAAQSRSFCLTRDIIKIDPTNKNSGTDWIQLVPSQDIIQLNPVTNINSGTLFVFMSVCKF